MDISETLIRTKDFMGKTLISENSVLLFTAHFTTKWTLSTSVTEFKYDPTPTDYHCRQRENPIGTVRSNVCQTAKRRVP